MAEVEARALEGMSAVAVRQGRATDAACYLGAVAEFEATSGAMVPLSERSRHDDTVQSARDLIDAADFAAAWAEGRAMTLDQAVAYALQ